MTDWAKYPTLATKVTLQQKERWDALLSEVRKTEHYARSPDLLRAFLGFDRRIKISASQKAYLAGDIPTLRDAAKKGSS